MVVRFSARGFLPGVSGIFPNGVEYVGDSPLTILETPSTACAADAISVGIAAVLRPGMSVISISSRMIGGLRERPLEVLSFEDEVFLVLLVDIDMATEEKNG
jgi:hypothetical protein